MKTKEIAREQLIHFFINSFKDVIDYEDTFFIKFNYYSELMSLDKNMKVLVSSFYKQRANSKMSYIKELNDEEAIFDQNLIFKSINRITLKSLIFKILHFYIQYFVLFLIIGLSLTFFIR